MEFGKLLERLRKEKHLSIRELSKMVHVSHTYISKIEKGLRAPPSDEIIAALAAALDYPPNHLFIAAGRLPPEYRKVYPSVEDLIEALATHLTPHPFRENKPNPPLSEELLVALRDIEELSPEAQRSIVDYIYFIRAKESKEHRK